MFNNKNFTLISFKIFQPKIMPKPQLEEHQLRLIIYKEWKSGACPNEAFENICQEFGQKSVTSTKVRRWFRQFEKDEVEIFDEDSSYKVEVESNCQQTIDCLLMLPNDERLKNEMKTSDGRFLFFTYSNSKDRRIWRKK